MRPLPDDIAVTVRPVAAKRPTRSDPVVSHHLAGLLRTSGLESIAPRNRKEFAAFPGFDPTFCQPKPTSDGRRSPFPARAVHTLRRIPLASSRTASLRPLPSCCSVASRPLSNTEVLDATNSACQQAPPHLPLSQPKPPERICHRVRTLTLTDLACPPKRSSRVRCTVLPHPRRGLAGRFT